MFGARWPDENIPVTAIMLYPNAGDQMGVAVTNNVEVCADCRLCRDSAHGVLALTAQDALMKVRRIMFRALAHVLVAFTPPRAPPPPSPFP